MLAPLIPYRVKGVIWYQGESNRSRAQEYRTLFPAMIVDWRLFRWRNSTRENCLPPSKRNHFLLKYWDLELPMALAGELSREWLILLVGRQLAWSEEISPRLGGRVAARSRRGDIECVQRWEKAGWY